MALAVEAPRFLKEKEAGLRRILSSQHLVRNHSASGKKVKRKMSFPRALDI
jgi:hypothetical protein